MQPLDFRIDGIILRVRIADEDVGFVAFRGRKWFFQQALQRSPDLNRYYATEWVG
jgi:hypothetical protein